LYIAFSLSGYVFSSIITILLLLQSPSSLPWLILPKATSIVFST